jgi:hypothetical protein
MADRGTDETREAAAACFEGAVMVEGFVLIATAVEAETGDKVWAIRTDPDQGAFPTMGLAHLASAYLDEMVRAQLGYTDEDDEE